MKSYDVVFVGYPNWRGKMPMAVFSFIEQHDFSGKNVVPFCTHEGSGLGRSMQDLRVLCPRSVVLDGLAIRGGNVMNAGKDVRAWLQQNRNTEGVRGRSLRRRPPCHSASIRNGSKRGCGR